jgi:acyl transferase domain-containing protein
VKTNVGHLEGAAGIAGLLKVVLSLQHSAIGPHLHLRRLNPHMPGLREDVRAVIPRMALAWGRQQQQQSQHRARFGAVSSFGMSGTNAHVIVGEAPSVAPQSRQLEAGAKAVMVMTSGHELPPPPPPRQLLVVLSAKSEGALRELARRYATHFARTVADDSEGSSSDIEVGASCAAIALCRAHMQPHRAAVVGAGRESLQARLSEVAEASPAPTLWATRRLAARGGGVGFLFTGQGSQYAGMGRELYETDDVFRRAVDACAGVLDPLLVVATTANTASGGWTPFISTVLYPPSSLYPTAAAAAAAAAVAAGSEPQSGGGDTESGSSSLIDRTRYAQPALFVVEYALAELWASLGVVPAYALGHSVGELAAACVAGVFGLEDGLRLVEARGRLMGALEGISALTSPDVATAAAAATTDVGVMTAVSTSEERVCAALDAVAAPVRECVSLAAVNGPQQVVLSGRRAAVEEVIAALEAQALASSLAPPRWQMLRVSNAFHSHLMEPMLDEFERVAAGVQFSRPLAHVRLASNVTGALVSTGGDDDGEAGCCCNSARYWRQHVRGTVRFDAAVRSVAAAGCRAFIEVGPHPVLLGLAAASLGDLHDERQQTASPSSPPPPPPSSSRAQLLLLASLRRGVPAWRTMLESVGRVFADGAIDVEFTRLVGVAFGGAATAAATNAAAAVLPTYPFQRKRHWVSSGDTRDRDPVWTALWPAEHTQAIEHQSAPASSSDGRSSIGHDNDIGRLLYEVVWQEAIDASTGALLQASTEGTGTGAAAAMVMVEATAGGRTGQAVVARLRRADLSRVTVLCAGATEGEEAGLGDERDIDATDVARAVHSAGSELAVVV